MKRVNPKGPNADGLQRILRGVAWGGPAWYLRFAYLRSALRSGHDPGYRDYGISLRIALKKYEKSKS